MSNQKLFSDFFKMLHEYEKLVLHENNTLKIIQLDWICLHNYWCFFLQLCYDLHLFSANGTQMHHYFVVQLLKEANIIGL
jgi:hypothetical protein